MSVDSLVSYFSPWKAGSQLDWSCIYF